MKTLLLILFFSAYSLTTFAQAKIEIVEGNSIDVGNVYKGEKISRKYTVRNIGKDTLVITNVAASCGCTAALISEKVIAPDSVGYLQTTFDSHNFDGKVTKAITITSNDPVTPSLQFHFSVNIIQDIELNPKQFYFKDMKIGVPSTNTVKVKNSGEKPVQILSWHCDDKNITVIIPEKELAPGEEAEMIATYTPTQAGFVTQSMDLVTSGEHQKNVNVRFYGNVVEK
ncbi:MAG: DUF1573 domain-containing protein [Bacteroidota bacterium]